MMIMPPLSECLMIISDKSMENLWLNAQMSFLNLKRGVSGFRVQLPNLSLKIKYKKIADLWSEQKAD